MRFIRTLGLAAGMLLASLLSPQVRAADVALAYDGAGCAPAGLHLADA
ncbi:hypothetical protein GRF61_07990 [Azoarcus sp. TTM-91]|nr:hypothetical protein [Azoarcus sp. TTM-91]NMG34386.1 hypothetical protein [Azoarcus sp. TTM-91]